MERKRWYGPVPNTDDFGDQIVKCFIDGKTKMGPWALMTPRSHRERGIGLGTGRGQRYKLESDGIWYKVEG